MAVTHALAQLPCGAAAAERQAEGRVRQSLVIDAGGEAIDLTRGIGGARRGVARDRARTTIGREAHIDRLGSNKVRGARASAEKAEAAGAVAGSLKCDGKAGEPSLTVLGNTEYPAFDYEAWLR
jgi:hypothetical protein